MSEGSMIQTLLEHQHCGGLPVPVWRLSSIYSIGMLQQQILMMLKISCSTFSRAFVRPVHYIFRSCGT